MTNKNGNLLRFHKISKNEQINSILKKISRNCYINNGQTNKIVIYKNSSNYIIDYYVYIYL